MKLKNILYTVLGLGLAGAILPNVLAQAKKDAPSAEATAKITAAIKALYPEAVISFYEVALTVKGNKIDANVTSDGTIIETEETTDMKLFPKAASEAIAKAAKGMKITGGELVKTFAKAVKDDSTGDTQVTHVVKLAEPTISYEVAVEQGTNKGELAVSAGGKVLETPKWAKTGADKEEDKD
jgi:hypothetical protein